jgi:hypothetical protein
MNTLVLQNPSDVTDWILSGSAYPGWFVHAGGSVQPLHPLNAIHMRFSIPRDSRDFSLQFEPFSFRFGLFLSLSTAAALAALLWLTIRRRQF